MLAGCVAPPPRDNSADTVAQASVTTLRPSVRGPVEAQRRQPEDPPTPSLQDDARALAAPARLDRIQADNRLRQAGTAGILAASSLAETPSATDEQLVQALRFIAAADFEQLGAEDRALVRTRLASLLKQPAGRVRIEAARALQTHGPGVQRTALLQALADTERRVRWAVVRRFGDHPEELQRLQREILLGFLEAMPAGEFERLDGDRNGRLTRAEFGGDEEDFARLDGDRDGRLSVAEATEPVPAEVRADVYALLLRCHERQTPGQRPPDYNPWAPAGAQLAGLAAWRAWSDGLPD